MRDWVKGTAGEAARVMEACSKIRACPLASTRRRTEEGTWRKEGKIEQHAADNRRRQTEMMENATRADCK